MTARKRDRKCLRKIASKGSRERERNGERGRERERENVPKKDVNIKKVNPKIQM